MTLIRNSDTYVYTPLESPTAFRLVEILPGTGSEPLKCRLHPNTVESHASFEGLSYTWGDSILTHSMYLDGNTLAVTAYLHSALVEVRLEDRSRMLWADAVCINQDDLVEREQQVSWIRKIFREADQVIVYLGEEADESGRLPQLFRDLAAIPDVSTGKTVFTVNYEELGLPPVQDTVWKAFAALFSRPWFTRTWIIQEVVLARTITIVCGSWRYSWLELWNHIRTAAVHGLPICSGTAADALNQMLLFVHLGAARNDVVLWKLIDLLQYCRLSNASDPRDYVYGVLSLALDAEDYSLQPNYSESANSYFFALLNSDHSPSWVPNWVERKQPPSIVPVPNKDNALAAAGGESAATISLRSGGTELEIHGLILDNLCHIGKRWGSEGFSYSDSKLKDHILLVLDCMSELNELLASAKSCPTREELEDVKWRTLICNGLNSSDGHTIDHWGRKFETLQSCAKLLQCELDEVDDPEGLGAPSSNEQEFRSLYMEGQGYCDMAMRYCTERRRAVTNKGYLAQVPTFAQQGDVVFIPLGSATPFVLRPKLHGYIVVGECYIHGVMNGEALQMENLTTTCVTLI